ncbi:CoxG family protein [Acuticoccus mangrovi]|uniref:Carbon monoxide dehydrogenase subunit G n=1 Tax=Acuticoccus mangrovi TaxID=2796142 RepID=A0A934MHC1_9HYPH|nr:carbon monoxide dehydrogenase subunit G [Acuticoccus mangrovi]MBJ3775901.1 carbon monoxide dehydrogenase subunit G [Acuticoccus mangrovi]
MELTGEHRIPAPRKVVWDALQDPEILKECIKGCQRLEKIDDRHMEATVQAKVGPVKATFEANVEIVDPKEPEGYTLTGEGKGGVAGFAKGSADVKLAEDGNDTILTYNASAKIGGKLAQLGSRLVDTTAKKYAADFFSTLSEKLSVAAVTPPPVAPAAEAAAPAAPAAPIVEEPMPEPDAAGRVEPSAELIDEGVSEAENAAASAPIDSPHFEDTIETQLEVAAGRRVWGGPWFWGILAFAAVILVLIALQ